MNQTQLDRLRKRVAEGERELHSKAHPPLPWLDRVRREEKVKVLWRELASAELEIKLEQRRAGAVRTSANTQETQQQFMVPVPYFHEESRQQQSTNTKTVLVMCRRVGARRGRRRSRAGRCAALAAARHNALSAATKTTELATAATTETVW
ncbi:MAG: hypothetical protein O7H39_08900 [Gammaproteobacteria bacterium]|nr:hypothetical protein [Gammaproteobacteria bacterium]